MANNKVNIDFDAMFQNVMKQPKVVAKAQQRATHIAGRARSGLAAAGIEASVNIRPVHVSTGRAIFNVEVTPAADAPTRGRNTPRRILRRSVGGSRGRR